jgi:ABC-type glycerol-3-phosphate transport system permease component
MTEESALRRGLSLRGQVTSGSVMRHVALWLVCLTALAPVYFLVVTSLKDKGEYLDNMWGPPQHPTLANFSTALADGRLLGWTWNSIVVTVLSVGFCTLVSALAAYAFARMRFVGRDTVLNIFIAMIVIPPVILIVPLFILVVNVNMVNTYWSAIVIYSGLMVPFSIYLLTNFFRTVPGEIVDAATIDGCSQFKIFTAVILPLSMPALITLIIVNALFVWNELLIALTFLQDDSVRTLMAGLTEFKGRFFLNQPLIMTGALIATVPMVLVYIGGQRFFVRGLVAGAVK